MIPIQHPLAKTATDLRRSINRLEIFAQQHSDDEFVANIQEMIEDLKNARRKIPVALRDQDLKESQ